MESSVPRLPINIARKNASLKHVSPDKVLRNPDNPRLFFRSEEMDSLLASIKQFGIQVPITVYEEDKKYVLIDGERRWRCAQKLNLPKIPAIIHEKPTSLDNLLLMFNIHALREQWDYFTIANKLPDLINLFVSEHEYEPNEIELSEITGLTRGQIRRCRLIMDLPDNYKKILLEELQLPKSEQKISEDYFLEMEKALKTVNNRLPNLIEDMNEVRDTLISKYVEGIIANVTDLRMVSKIATAIEGLGVRKSKAIKSLKAIFGDNEIGIKEIFEEYFELRYDENKLYRYVTSVSEYLNYLDSTQGAHFDHQLRRELKNLRELIDIVLKD